MIKISARALKIQLPQHPLPRMPKRSMPDIMSQGNGLDQVRVQPKDASDISGNPGHQLHMLGTPGNIIIPVKGKDLGFVSIAVVIGNMHDLLGIPHKGGPPQVGPVVIHSPPEHILVPKGKWIFQMVFSIPADSFL